MGNCLFAGLGDDENHASLVTILKSDGGALEFRTPITAGCITEEFPGHSLFPTRYRLWKPLSPHSYLSPGESYYLLSRTFTKPQRQGHNRSNSVPLVPYRMSLDYKPRLLTRSYTDVVSKHYHSCSEGENPRKRSTNVFWKVKLVIQPTQLAEILSREGSTGDLVESVRAVAKCGTHPLRYYSSSLSSASSDQWSLSGSRYASSSNREFVLLNS